VAAGTTTKFRSSPGSALRVTALLLLWALAAGCGKRSTPVGPAASAVPAAAPAPAGLLADGFVREPGRLYPALKQLGGPRARLLPAGFELVLSSALGLPAQAAGRLAPGRPLLGAWLVLEGGEVAGVLGVPLTSGVELVRDLARPGGAIQAELERASGITLLAPPEGPRLGVLDDWLLVSTTPEAIRVAGAYVARNLSRRALPPEPLVLEVPEAALSGPLVAALRARWTTQRAELAGAAEQAQKAHGRPADYGDPGAVLAFGDGAVGALLDTLASCRTLRFTLSPLEERLELVLELTPRPGGLAAQSIRTLAVGPLDALLALPATAVLALFTRAGENEAEAGVIDPAGALRGLFGQRLAEREAAAASAAFASFQRGRGATAAYALLADRTLLAKHDVRDRAELEAGVAGLLALLRAPAVKEPLAPLVGEISARESELRLPGSERPLRRLEIVRARGADKPGLEALWLVNETSAALSIAPDARPGFVALAAARPEASLAANPAVKAMAGRRSPAGFALYANLGPFGREPGDAQALVTFGKRGENARIEAELSRGGVLVLASRLVPP
jgi:hypothetical protein